MEEKMWFLADEYDNDERPSREFLQNMGEAAIYWYLRRHGGGTRIQLAENGLMHARTVQRAIKALQSRGIIYGR